jgi:hypothetical protein
MGFCCAWLGGCVLADPGASGVVLLDPEAASSQPTVEQHMQGRGAGVLPLLVDSDAPVTVRAAGASQSFTVEPGELVQLRGARLELTRYLLDRDVYRDRLELETTRAVADEVAAQISAEVSERALGAYELEVANAYAHLAQLEPDEITSVQPVAVAKTTAVPADRNGSAAGASALRDLDRAAPASGSLAVLQTANEEPDPVGFYHCGDATLALDASNRFHSCAFGEGRYRMQGRQLTLEGPSGTTVLQIDPDGSLSGRAEWRCTLGTAVEETP